MPTPCREYSRLAASVKARAVRGGQRASVLAFAWLLLAPLAARASDGCERLAGRLASAAQRLSKRRVAVLPFQPIGPSETLSGLVVAERLVGHLLEGEAVAVVERTLLEAVLREQRLELSGAVSAESVRELGRVLGVDALVSGTVLGLKDGRVEVNARLIDAETAQVLAAATARVDKEWETSLLDEWDLKLPPVPSLDEPKAPAWGGFRDGMASRDTGCERSRQTLGQLEAALVDLKARYWAGRLRGGLRLDTLTSNPGSEIRDPEARRRFYERLRERYESADSEPLTPEEVQRLETAQSRLERLARECGGEG